jgi:hypothetical protein
VVAWRVSDDDAQAVSVRTMMEQMNNFISNSPLSFLDLVFPEAKNLA